MVNSIRLYLGLLISFILFVSCKKTDDDSTPTTPTNPVANEYPDIPRYSWPIENGLNDRNIIINYYDDNKGEGFLDQDCGISHGYDGHQGVDIAIPSFRHMDEGIAVVASAPGKVRALEVSKHDRVYWTPYVDSGNYVSIQYPDGSFTVYYHLRKNSVTVRVGEQVERGQIIGYVGSSGATPFPHLHLETKVPIQGGFESINPFAGRCNDAVSLWSNQPHYVAQQPLKVLDMGTFVDFQYDGEYQFGIIKELKDRPISPAVVGLDRGRLGLWTQFQGNQGDQYTVIITKPDGSIFKRSDKTLASKRRYGWHGMNWSLTGIGEEDFGTWNAKITMDGQTVKQINFEVGATTEFGPTFYPLAGRSIVVGGSNTELEIPLTWQGDEQQVTLTIDDNSSGISLSGNSLIIPGSSSQANRNHWVNVTAADSKGRKDTYRLHMIDKSKPFN